MATVQIKKQYISTYLHKRNSKNNKMNVIFWISSLFHGLSWGWIFLTLRHQNYHYLNFYSWTSWPKSFTDISCSIHLKIPIKKWLFNVCEKCNIHAFDGIARIVITCTMNPFIKNCCGKTNERLTPCKKRKLNTVEPLLVDASK